jgi:hypothetical protein
MRGRLKLKFLHGAFMPMVGHGAQATNQSSQDNSSECTHEGEGAVAVELRDRDGRAQLVPGLPVGAASPSFSSGYENTDTGGSSRQRGLDQ